MYEHQSIERRKIIRQIQRLKGSFLQAFGGKETEAAAGDGEKGSFLQAFDHARKGHFFKLLVGDFENCLGHFFKLLVGDFENCLRIPPAFVKYLENGITQATLECPNGMIRHVKLQQKTGGLYFQDGWKDFVQDHLLQAYDCLVFAYEGGAKFSLEMFDHSACEKEDGCTKKAPSQSKFYDQRKKQSTTFDSVQDECTSPNLHGLSKTKTARFKGSSSNKRLRRQPGLAGSNGGAREKAESFSSKFPSFIVEMKNIVLVRIPNAFSKHFPIPEGKMTLQCPDGRLWVVKYIWSRQRAFFSGGWRAFARDNGLVRGDFCVFELLDKNKIRVHIFCLAE
ncbi:hypothetical protein ACLOJK_019173 [Asimina triloba]